MTAPNDPDRRVRAFLADGPDQLPERSYDAVRSHIDRTRQRAVIGPWREPPMRTIFTLGLASAAVLAIVVAGWSLLPGRTAPGPGASAEPTSVPYTWPGPLASGTYTTSMIWDLPFAYSFTIGEGWQGRDVEIVSDTRGVSLMFARVDNVYADPCTRVLRDPPVEPTVEGLAAALAALPGVDGTTPVAATLADRPGQYLEFTVGSDAGCGLLTYHLWTTRAGWMRPAEHQGGTDFSAERAHYRVWALDVGGDVFLVAALSDVDAAPAALADLQSVIDSIRFVPPVEATVRGACTLHLTNPAGGEVSPPYTVTLGPRRFEVRGPMPVDENENPLTPAPPLAQLNLTGEGWATVGTNRPGLQIVAPAASSEVGFSTSTTVNGFQGSAVFDAPGRWWVRVSDGAEACVRQFAADVLPLPAP